MRAEPAPRESAAEEDAPASSVVAEGTGAPGDEGAPVGPTDGEEAAFLAEQREQGDRAPSGVRAANGASASSEPENDTPLPPLDELVSRIPAATRQLMDELFRARFVTVKRVPPSALKN